MNKTDKCIERKQYYEEKTFKIILNYINNSRNSFNYCLFFFHFVGDEGIREWQPEAGKPFVTDLIGMFGVLFLWSSAMSLILALTVFNDKKK